MQIRIVGTDLQTETDTDGMFMLKDVPAGGHQMEFDYDGHMAYFNVTVPDQTTITMNNIHIDGNTVTMSEMHSTMMSSVNPGGGQNMGMN